MKAGDERCLAWAAQAREIAASNPLESRELLLTGMRARERQDERWADKVSSEKAEEIQWVADWTFDMAALAWEFLIAQERNPRSTMARIDKLRDMRLWDMVVVRDVLRDHDTLLEEQCELSPWILPGSSTLIFCARFTVYGTSLLTINRGPIVQREQRQRKARVENACTIQTSPSLVRRQNEA